MRSRCERVPASSGPATSFAGVLRFEIADGGGDVAVDERGVGTDGRQRARDDVLRVIPPGGGEVAFVAVPVCGVVVPVTHDFVHAAPVDRGREAAHVFDEVTEEDRVRPRKASWFTKPSSDWFNA